MPFSLLKYGISNNRPVNEDLPAPEELKKHYDVIIIGGGGHGLATAYYLSHYHNITDIAVIEKSYIGGGNTARNTAVIRSNYMTPEGTSFYIESLRLFKTLSSELGFNIMYSERGQLTLAHSDATLRAFRQRTEVNKHLGGRTELIDPQQIKALIPLLNPGEDGLHPVIGGLWHIDGATARHDAVAWAYAKRAAEKGVEIHQMTEVTGLDIQSGQINAVFTNRGRITCGCAVQAVAGHSSLLANMAGFRLPVVSYPCRRWSLSQSNPSLTRW